jgi:hypothetical protein
VANNYGIELAGSAATNVLVQGNTINVQGTAPVLAGIRVTNGTTHRVFDNVIVPSSKPELSIAAGVTPLVRSGFRNRGAKTGVVNGGTIAHGLPITPSRVAVTATVAGEMASATGVNATNITVAILKHTGAAGTAQTIYWEAEG